MLDIMKHTETEDIEAVILSLDFVKCFDKCSFQILHGSLEFFKFGEIVKQWTKILYNDCSVKIQNNGNFSGNIPIKKGVHQGGCCSSVYFLVIAEILALALRSNEEIDGITIADIKNLLNQFADDMDISTLCNEKSIRNIYEELNKFYLQSGFTVSYEKNTLYRIGSLRHSDACLYNMSQYVWSNQDINVLGVTISHHDIVNKNYQPLLEKSKKILDSWKNRGLSLIGKIQVVNTLIASLFVYKMMVLPTIPKKFIQTMDNIIREYLWGGKKAKIAYKILQNSKKEGGLDLINLEIKDKSLKATWPQILHKETEYAKLVYQHLKCSAIQEDIWRCSLKKEDVKKLKIKDQFWENVLEHWCEFNYYRDRHIENQLIWYNSNIRIRDKPIMWNDCYNKGLKYIHQLYQEGQYKTDQQVWQQFGLSKLRFNSLKTVIPKDWKEYFISTNRGLYNPIRPHNYDMALNTTKLSQTVYKSLQGDILLLHNKYIKWNQEISMHLYDGLIDYGTQHLHIYKTTNIPKYRSFQYRLMQRGLVTNIQLLKWKMKDNSNCSFCGKEPETLVHLFTQCQKVVELWEELISYIRNRYNITIHLDPKGIILNQLQSISKTHIANFMCLITKQYIYRQRCLNKELQFRALKAQIQSIEQVEKYIAVKNGKLNKHTMKWKGKNVAQMHVLDQNSSIQNYIDVYIDNL